MVGLSYYYQPGATELLIMSDPHYGRMCFNGGPIVLLSARRDRTVDYE